MLYLIILPVIMWQSLFLLIAIAWDAFLFYRQLRVRRKVAIEYARTLNIFTLVLCWLVFFLVIPSLPQSIELEIISLIFFSRPFKIQIAELQMIFVWSFLLINVATTAIKFTGMIALQSLLQNFSPVVASTNPIKAPTRLDRKPSFIFTSELSIIFLSNVLINTSIAILLFLKSRY